MRLTTNAFLPAAAATKPHALAATAPLIDALGGAEDLAAHVEAVRVRVES